MPLNPTTLSAVTQQLTVSRHIVSLAELPKLMCIFANSSHMTMNNVASSTDLGANCNWE